MSKTYPVLIGDIGGTNVRLSILKISKDINVPYEELETAKMQTDKYSSLEDAVEEFLRKYKNTENYPLCGVVGVAGPVKENAILKFTNIEHWPKVKGENFEKRFNMKRFLFLNDFTCNAYGIQGNLKLDKDYIILNDVPRQENGGIGIVGPGSGLGMSYLLKDPQSEFYTIGASEGGHQDYFSKNKKHYELAEFMKKFLGQTLLSVERVCSGQGIIPIYKFLQETEKDIKRDEELGKKIDEIKDFKAKFDRHAINIEIVKKGLKDECPLCKKVLELFVEIFGEVSGNAALFCLPTNGLYLVGGLSSALKDLIKNTSIFMDHFINKDDFQYLLKTFPVYLVMNEQLGLIGAAECARRLILKTE